MLTAGATKVRMALNAKQESAGKFTATLDLPDAPMGSYLVQLPPDYHHQRAHPLLMLIHGDREAPETLLKRWAPLAAQNGFIVAAPLWKKFLN